ncbi:hypothetical protein HDU80_002494 [Chytriomyces hyalinus]|nr:hypothetical protein HDU80_002494 [Chytriomyces hyalinus]
MVQATRAKQQVAIAERPAYNDNNRRRYGAYNGRPSGSMGRGKGGILEIIMVQAVMIHVIQEVGTALETFQHAARDLVD